MKNLIKHITFFLLLAALVSSGFSQFIYFPYYGKNKVLYTKFDWDHYETDHFDIYYYSKDDRTLKRIAELAESAYKRISNDIKHDLSAKVPFLYYCTTTDFQQTNLFQMPEGVLGAAEPLLYRVALHGDMPDDELQDLVEHELTHIFEYDLLWGSPGGVLYSVSQPASWIMEGFSEYNTHNWSCWSSLIVRDSVLNDRIPEINKMGELSSQYLLPRDPAYDFGHAIYEFIEFKYGKNGIQSFWHSMKNSSLAGKTYPIKRAFNKEHKEFNYEFKKYLRNKFKPFLLRENPEDYSLPIGPEFPLNPYYFSFSHALSPSGDIVAILTYNVKDSDIDIVLLSTKDGSVIKNITKGYTLKYEHIKREIDPSKGKDLSWSPDGDMIAFFGRAGQKHSLYIVNALTGKTLRTIKIPYDQPASPCFFPEKEELLFTAFQNGIPDIFKINLENGKILNMTEDDAFEKAPSISPDGKVVAYTIHLDTYDKLFLSPTNNLKNKTQLTFGRANTITPEFSRDSEKIYFSGDTRGAFNIYSLNLKTGELKRYTDVTTGNFFPFPHPKGPKTIIFSSFNKGSFQVFKSDLEGEVEKNISFAEKSPDDEFKKFEPIVTFEIDKKKIQAHKGMGKLYLTGRPPVDTIISTDGSIYGGSALSFSDLFRDYTFSLTAYQVRNFRSYYFSYLNQKNRLQYMASAFQYTIFYYPSYYYFNPSLFNFLSYRDAIATRKISGINVSAYYPFNLYYRTQATLSYNHYEEDFYDPYLNQFYGGGGYSMFWNGSMISTSLSLTGETTHFKYYGPAAGNTFQFGVTQGIPISSSFLRNTTVQADYRKYLNIGSDFLLAFRINCFVSRGKNPYITYFGGNNQVRSAYYYSIVGNEGWYSNLEFRFPVINAANTIIGQIGPVRGTLFFDVSRSKLKGYSAQFASYVGTDEYGLPEYRFFDALGSYGFGFQFFFLGLPFHIEFVKRLEFPDFSNPLKFDTFGKFQTKFWIGFDF